MRYCSVLAMAVPPGTNGTQRHTSWHSPGTHLPLQALLAEREGVSPSKRAPCQPPVFSCFIARLEPGLCVHRAVFEGAENDLRLPGRGTCRKHAGCLASLQVPSASTFTLVGSSPPRHIGQSGRAPLLYLTAQTTGRSSKLPRPHFRHIHNLSTPHGAAR